MNVPAELKYTKEHLWVRLSGDEATIGITDHAQQELGDVVFVELPGTGTAVTRLKAFGVVESVKAVSDLFAPVTGTVVRINEELAGTPELLNQDPYGTGWILVVAPTDSGEFASLMSAAQYEGYAAEVQK